jgi:hypothetical protein
MVSCGVSKVLLVFQEGFDSVKLFRLGKATASVVNYKMSEKYLGNIRRDGNSIDV